MSARRSARAALGLGALAAAACGDRIDDPLGRAPAGALRPAAAPEGAGLALAFLSPLGVTPPLSATFDGGRAPAVEVCPVAARTAAACDGAPVARWTRAEATVGAPLAVDVAQQLYRTDWPLAGLPAGQGYRVRVLLDGAELGRAHARVPAAGETAAQVQASGWVPLGNGTRLPIRFRLETSTGYVGGDPAAPVASLAPREFEPHPQDYATTHPSMPGVPVSFNTLFVTVRPGVARGELNALLASLGARVVGALPGVPGVAGSILALRLPTTTHAALAAVRAALAADPRIATVAHEALGAPLAATRASTTPATADGWRWDRTPGGGNWGLELSRVPQLWNLNPSVAHELAQAAAAGHQRPATGIVDAGFSAAHPDVRYRGQLLPVADEDEHGTAVAGVIGATFDDGVGIDGVNPFAQLVAKAPDFSVRPGSTPTEWRLSIGRMIVWAIPSVITSDSLGPVRVLNVSLGYNWAKAGISTDDPTVRELVDGQGRMAKDMFAIVVARQKPLPFVTSAAGNDSHTRLGLQEAAYGAPLANAALRQGVAAITVVEAVRLDAGSRGGATRAAFSNVHGHLSAPGAGVLVPVAGDSVPGRYGYTLANGTSIAAPFVAGVASYLYALAPDLPAPTMESNPVRDLLVRTAVEVGGGAAPRVDAFAAALAAGQLVGGDRVLRRLVDVDDGTTDGNLRTALGGDDYAPEEARGGAGDGRVDMRDFRRWRDWMLQVEGGRDVLLDGTARHPKKDVNRNHRFAVDGDDENVFPRGDFNGDGRLSLDSARLVPGAGAQAVTDLQVLMRVFQDPDVRASELPQLVHSADLTLNARRCLAVPGVVRVRARAYPTAPDAAPLVWRRLDADTLERIFTVPRVRGGYSLRVEALDAAGRVVTTSEREFGELPDGADVRWTACGRLTVSPREASLRPGEAATFAAAVEGDAAARITWSTTGGAVTGGGHYTAPAAPGTYLVVARSATDASATDTARVTVASGATARVRFIGQGSRGGASASTSTGERTTAFQDSVVMDPRRPESFGGGVSAVAPKARIERYYPEYDWTAWAEVSASASVSGQSEVSVAPDGTMRGYSASGQVRISTTLTNNSMHWMPPAGSRAAAWFRSEVRLQVDEPVVARVAGGCGSGGGSVAVERPSWPSNQTVGFLGCGGGASEQMVLSPGSFVLIAGTGIEGSNPGGRTGQGGSWTDDKEASFSVGVTFEAAPPTAASTAARRVLRRVTGGAPPARAPRSVRR